MIFDVGPIKVVVLLVIGVILFGPDKLPKMIAEAGRFIRTIREFSNNATREIRSELGPQFEDLELQDLNPRAFIRKQWDDHAGELGLTQLQDLRHDVTQETLTAAAAARNGGGEERGTTPDQALDEPSPPAKDPAGGDQQST